MREDLIKATDSGSDDDRRGGGARVGDKVEARYRGRSKYYPGKISRVHSDGTFDIDYDDGEQETRVLEEYVKKAGSSSSLNRTTSVVRRRGERVEARYRGRAKYYKGRITRDNGDGTYDIDYDDGEMERGVATHLVRSLESGTSGINDLD